MLGTIYSRLQGRELHGNTGGGNTAVMENGEGFYHGSGSNGRSFYEINMDYSGKTTVTAEMGTNSALIPR